MRPVRTRTPLERVVNPAFGTLAVKALAAPTSFVLLAFAARLMTDAAYGRFTVLLAAAGFGGVLFSLGLPVLLAKYPLTARYSLPSGTIWDSWTSSLHALSRPAVLITGTVLCIVVLATVPGFTIAELSAGILLTVAFGAAELATGGLRGVHRPVLATAPRDVVWRALSIASFAIVVWTGSSLTAGVATTVVALLLLLVAGTQIGHLAQLRSPIKDSEPIRLHRGLEELRSETRSHWGNTLGSSVTTHLTTVIVGAGMGVEAAATFFIALRLAQLLSLPLNALNTFTGPRLSAAFLAGDDDGLRDLVRRTTVLSSALAGIGLLGYAVLGEQILSLFGTSHVSGLGILLVLSLGRFLNSCFGPIGEYMQMVGLEAVLLRLRVAADTALLVLVAATAVYGGAMAAAVAITTSTVVLNAAALSVMRRTGRPYFSR